MNWFQYNGHFLNHIMPGLFWIVFGMVWMVQTFRRHFQGLISETTRKQPTQPFYSSVMFPVVIRRRRINIEAYMGLLFTMTGIIAELLGSLIDDGYIKPNNMQHTTMYFYFGLTCFCDLVLQKIKVIPQSDDIVYMLLTLSYFVEGLLFKYHLLGRTDLLDVTMHTFLVYSIFVCSIVTILEMRNRRNVLLPLGRAFTTMLQGTWFFQIAFVIYPYNHPEGISSKLSEHEQIMLQTCIFTWHMAAILFLIIVTGILIGVYYTRRYGISTQVLLDKHFAVQTLYCGDSNDSLDSDRFTMGKPVMNNNHNIHRYSNTEEYLPLMDQTEKDDL